MRVICPFCGEIIKLKRDNSIPLHYASSDNQEEFNAYEDVCDGSNQPYEEDEEEEDRGPGELNFD